MKTDTIPILNKAVRVLAAVAQGRSYTSMTQMAKALDIAPTTCFRILKTFEAADWVSHSDGGEYRLSAGLLPLAGGLSQWQELIEAARQPMHELAGKLRLAVKLSVREGLWQVTLHRVESPRAMAATGRVGSRFALISGSSGAALIAGDTDEQIEQWIASADAQAWTEQSADDVRRRVAQCRRQGVCENIGINPRGLDTMSVPLKTKRSVTVGAVTLIGLRGDFGKNLRPIRQALKAAADQCHRAIVAGDMDSVTPLEKS